MTGRRGERALQGQRTTFFSGIPGPAVEQETGSAHGASEESHEKLLKRAKNSAYRYLTIRPRSRSEVEANLSKKAFPPDIVSSVIEHLLSLGYINDEQFAAQWAASRVRTRGFGRRRVEQELRQKGIARDIIGATLKGLFDEESEGEVARKEAEKKLRTLSRFEPEVRKRRLAGHLERKGFASEVIWNIIRTIW